MLLRETRAESLLDFAEWTVSDDCTVSYDLKPRLPKLASWLHKHDFTWYPALEGGAPAQWHYFSAGSQAIRSKLGIELLLPSADTTARFRNIATYGGGNVRIFVRRDGAWACQLSASLEELINDPYKKMEWALSHSGIQITDLWKV